MASPEASTATSSRSPSQGDQTRERLITATTECLKRFGIAKTGVIDIVRQAGSSRQTAYRYFSGRRDLIYHAILRAAGDLLARIPKAVAHLDDPEDILVETMIFLLRELPRDEVFAQTLGPGALATLQPIGPDRAATGRMARASLEPYREAVGTVTDEDIRSLSEHVNRLVLSAMLLGDGDDLLRADDRAREKLRAWLGPTVERHVAATAKKRKR